VAKVNALLKADHRKVEGLFAQFEKAKASSRKKDLAAQICLELTVHTKIEEDVFYPGCREDGVDEDLMNEAYVEHDGAKVLVAEIEAGNPDDQYYDAKV
jgi:hemerythrin superfamily protein